MRKYIAPAVESEEMLEQTSLACNVTSLPSSGPSCASTYRKNPGYFDATVLVCSIVLIQNTCMVALS